MQQQDPEALAWMWGANGAAGVLASIAAVMVSMTLGIEWNLLLAGAGYVVLPLLARAIGEPVRDDARRRCDVPADVRVPGSPLAAEPAPLAGDAVARPVGRGLVIRIGVCAAVAVAARLAVSWASADAGVFADMAQYHERAQSPGVDRNAVARCAARPRLSRAARHRLSAGRRLAVDRARGQCAGRRRRWCC